MKIVKIVSFICVLALALTLVSSFAFATASEAEIQPRSQATDFYAGHATILFSDKNESNILVSSIPKGSLLSATSDSGWSYNEGYSQVTYGGKTGYVRNKTVIPADECWKVSSSGTYLYNSASTTSGYKYNFPFPVNTYFQKSTATAPFHHARMYHNSSSYTGYVLRSHVTDM